MHFLLSARDVGVAGESHPHECKGPFLKRRVTSKVYWRDFRGLTFLMVSM